MEQDDLYDDDGPGNLYFLPRPKLTVLSAQMDAPIQEMDVNNWIAGYSVNLADLRDKVRDDLEIYLQYNFAGNLSFPGQKMIGQPVSSNQFPDHYLAVKRTFGVLTLGYLSMANNKWYFKTDIYGDFQELDNLSQYHWGINPRPKIEGRVIEVSFSR